MDTEAPSPAMERETGFRSRNRPDRGPVLSSRLRASIRSDLFRGQFKVKHVGIALDPALSGTDLGMVIILCCSVPVNNNCCSLVFLRDGDNRLMIEDLPGDQGVEASMRD